MEPRLPELAALTQVRVCALRLMGNALGRLDADDRAVECWAEAHRLEEHIAGRQITDNVRIGMLQAVPDEYDERIRAASAVLDERGPEATAAIVVAMEAARGARIDSHGQHEHGDPTKSWLQLAPEGPDGRLRPEELQWMDLRGCGTLVLGASESGMTQRAGRDERIGFVRAAVHAGAAAVVAARWAAVDLPARDHPARWACWTLYGDSGWLRN